MRRDTGKREFAERNALAQRLQNMREVATQFRGANTRYAETYAAFKEID